MKISWRMFDTKWSSLNILAPSPQRKIDERERELERSKTERQGGSTNLLHTLAL